MVQEPFDAYLDKCRATIAQCGHMVQGVMGSPAYFYTVGLTDKLGYELVTVGLPATTANGLLNQLASLLLAGEIEDNVNIDEIASMPLRLRTVKIMEAESQIDRSKLFGVAFRAGYQPTWVRQLIWPSAAGIFPGEPGHYCPLSHDLEQFM